MTKLERIKRNIENNKEIIKTINSVNYASIESFIENANDYIKAIKEGRMFCIIHRVSRSGMSRTISFHSTEKAKNNYYHRNYFMFFKMLGYRETKNGFSISGCGMDMIFHTNYTIIRRLQRLGFISKKQATKLEQMTPTTF